MSFEDFTTHFSALNVCKVKTCNELRMKGTFVRVLTDEKRPTDSVISKYYY